MTDEEKDELFAALADPELSVMIEAPSGRILCLKSMQIPGASKGAIMAGFRSEDPTPSEEEIAEATGVVKAIMRDLGMDATGEPEVCRSHNALQRAVRRELGGGIG